MNLDWITSPLAIYGVMAAGGAAALHLVVSTRIDLRRQQKRHQAESQSSQEAIVSLEEKVRQLSAEMKDNRVPPTAYTAHTQINLHKRAEALRMYRGGSDSHTVSKVLGMSRAEVLLLEKVQSILNTETAA